VISADQARALTRRAKLNKDVLEPTPASKLSIMPKLHSVPPTVAAPGEGFSVRDAQIAAKKKK
jgi:hypothetical protein